MKKYLVGILVFLLMFSLFAFAIYQKDFFAINDFITSLLLVIGFLFSIFIYLGNKNIISSTKSIYLIENIPSYIPFSHTLKSYLLSLIKIQYKVVVLLRTLDEKNYEWVLNQIAAYNHILKEGKTVFEQHEDITIEFLFVDKYSDDIHNLMQNLQVMQYHYIIITSLSDIFRQTIIARENLSDEKKECIQIIGALSSINDQTIEKIVNKDDKIIRIFPPDYDEAKTAIEFMFSKIKSSICTDQFCTLYHQKNNIIIFHNGTYGRAVRDQCQLYYEKERNKVYNNTTSEMTALNLEQDIGFYSFDYKSSGEIVYDGIESQSFEIFLEEWRDSKNHFFLIGYEPNISSMLDYLDKKLTPYPDTEKCFLFCGTASMPSWKDSINTTLKASHSLGNISDYSYYLKLLMYNSYNSPFVDTTSNSLNIELYRHVNDLPPEHIDLKASLMEILPNKHEREIDNTLNYYWTKEESYISIFSTLSILIAQHTIEHHTTLLKSKSKVLHEYRDEIDILVNGDSINQYTVSLME